MLVVDEIVFFCQRKGPAGAQVRRKLIGKTEPVYSQYTCYTGIADFTPPDIDTVGYRVFLGNGKYFVSSDVGGGKMQWCAARFAGRCEQHPAPEKACACDVSRMLTTSTKFTRLPRR